MKPRFHAKRALVLGSSRGLGLGIARNLAAEGARVIITGRDIIQLTGLADELHAETGSVIYPIACDLSHENASTELFAAAIDALGGIDILVNNSGGPASCSAEHISIEQWKMYFSSMVLRLIELSQLCIAGMRAQQWGRILTIASSGVVQPIANLALSNVLRSALLAWNKTLATEVAKDNITVNTILPGKILTDRLQALNQSFARKNKRSTEDFERDLLASIPIGRFGRVEEFADVATFYLSEFASYVTGATITVDGGHIACT